MIARTENIAIHNLMNEFELGGIGLFDYVDTELDLSIDHFKDDADTQWQKSKNAMELGNLFGRLQTEIFPKGTKILRLESQSLGEGWYITHLSQQFWYGLKKEEVIGRSLILSHESDGKVDYFRETVQSVIEIQALNEAV